MYLFIILDINGWYVYILVWCRKYICKNTNFLLKKLKNITDFVPNKVVSQNSLNKN